MTAFQYRKDIDGLRAIAVLPVVFNHAGLPGFSGGFVGVDIFFVISGFLITGILIRELQEGRFSLIRFYERRARRILPALFVVLLACLIGGWALLTPAGYASLAKSTGATLMFGSNVWFWRDAGDYFGLGVELAPLLHTWSLAVEEQFYLIFPLVLWALASRPGRVTVLTIAALSVLSLFLSVWMTQAAPTANFYLSPPRAWELGAGALLALGMFGAPATRAVRDGAGLAGLILIAGSIAFLSSESPFPGLTAIPPVLGAFLIIWAGGGGVPSLAGRILSSAPLVFVGLISYSLYLWHWPILVAARLYGHEIDLPMGTALGCIAVAAVAATLSWRYVERPFRTGWRQRQIFALSAAGGAALAATALVVLVQSGLPGRFFPDRLRAYEIAVARDALNMDCMERPAAAPPCVIGRVDAAGSPGTVVVWGDSHAGALVDGFDALLRAQGIHGVAFTKAACPPLLGIRRADREAQVACDTYNAQVLDTVEAMPDVAVVVLVARWALAVEGTRLPGELGRPVVLARGDGPDRGTGQNAELMAEGLGQLVERLRARDIAVILVEGVPEIGLNVPEMSLRVRDAQALEARLPTRDAYDARNRRANDILEAIADRYGAAVVAPADVLCGTTCLVRAGDGLLYRDDDHLSTLGARWLIPRLFTGALMDNLRPSST